ncbi:hypothetical protein E1A91_D07G136900v1 [Gossypium mustelinum]|uniref:Tetrahydrofolate dehydrogenase/cyclohydrolase NAD(P)-binding domain-containing protein n=1 Tax=Gossypium mustelinum TaxID=34275 RepID=A0A5D2U7K3_GOSMU|nr:hypothetical protein E1A91_D07G136900v1 [Gossypium mustelinum]
MYRKILMRMRMRMMNATRKVVVGWAKEYKRYLSTTTTNQILLSPPLVSVDLPEIWGSTSTLYHHHPSQSPVSHLDEEKILNLVSLEKDVDGFHPINMGNLSMRGREPLFVPCTPKGCLELLLRSGVEIVGKKAVVIGRSNIVGLPIALLLQRHHATVTIVHACTKNPERITCEADIVVTAAGVPSLIRSSWLKPGAVVIDVGTCPVEDPSAEYGYRLVGDVCYEEALSIASAVTPVPGGVEPMTIAMLLCNTLDSAKRLYGFT